VRRNVADVMRERDGEIVKTIDQSAQDALERLCEREAAGRISPNDPTYPRKKVAEWAVSMLWQCYHPIGCPPPSHLVALIAHLLGVESSCRGFNEPDGYRHAAAYLAEHPEASNREIGKAVGRSKDTIGKWRQEESFDMWVRLERGFIEWRANK